MSSSSPVGYRGEALLSVGPDIWFSPRAESGRRPETVGDRDTTLKVVQLTPICARPQASRARGPRQDGKRKIDREKERERNYTLIVAFRVFF